MKSLFSLIFILSVMSASAQMSKNVLNTSKIPQTADQTDWGHNSHRARNLPVKAESLNDIRKVATLRNDTLFVHKRVEPFNTVKEQVKADNFIKIIYKNKEYLYKVAVFDEADFYAGKKGLQIY